MEAKCQQCGRVIKIIPGHRPRQYCSDECRQTAFRRRHGVKAKPYKESRLSRMATIIWEMKKKWPNLSHSTYYMLAEIQEKYGEKLATMIGERFWWEVENARKQS